MKKIIEIYKKYPLFFYGLAFSLLGFILHDKIPLSFAMGLFAGAMLYESKEK
jgi:hypothetical protein